MPSSHIRHTHTWLQGLFHHHRAKLSPMGTAPIRQILYPPACLANRGCHSGSRIDIHDHAVRGSRRPQAAKAVITGWITNPDLAAIARRLQSAPGFGPVVAATLIAELPEPGSADRRRIAALAGLAPIARDSGRRSAPRSIGGGRPIVRTVLYLAALQASRRSPEFIRFRERPQIAGKSVNAAIIATAGKLLVILNAMLASDADYSPTAPA